MAKVFKFQGEKVEEKCCCEACEITDEYLEIALTCDDEAELRTVLRSIYEDAERNGYQDAL